MPEQKHSLEKRVDQLAQQVEILSRRVDELTTHRERAGPLYAISPGTQGEKKNLEATEELLSWVGKSSLLQRLATLCFLLVLALALRTATDSEALDYSLGTFIGMGYASLLMVIGWHKYGLSSPLASVFTVCGALLMFAVVGETHAHFESLPAIPAYVLLLLTGIALAAASRHRDVALPIMVGTLGMSVTAISIGFPNPIFSYLMFILLTANVLGYSATKLRRCSWLRWILLLIIIAMYQVWAIKLGFSHRTSVDPGWRLSASLFFPAGIFLTVAFSGMALVGMVRNEKLSKFDLALPAVSAICLFYSARYLLAIRESGSELLGTAGILVALVHLGIASWLARREPEKKLARAAFTLSSILLLIFALPAAFKGLLPSLPVLSVLALALAFLSHQWESPRIRVLAYALQAFVGMSLFVLLRGNGPETSSLFSAASAGAVALIALLNYRWCRLHPPSMDSIIFNRFDTKDRIPVIILLTALTGGFFLLRAALYHIFVPLPGDINDTYRCAQSIMINASAAGLMLFAYIRHNREIRNVAVLVTVIGGIKVLLYDLFGTSGLPLVFSVFSFGVIAALESALLGRWQHGLPENDKKTDLESSSEKAENTSLTPVKPD